MMGTSKVSKRGLPMTIHVNHLHCFCSFPLPLYHWCIHIFFTRFGIHATQNTREVAIYNITCSVSRFTLLHDICRRLYTRVHILYWCIYPLLVPFARSWLLPYAIIISKSCVELIWQLHSLPIELLRPLACHMTYEYIQCIEWNCRRRVTAGRFASLLIYIYTLQ